MRLVLKNIPEKEINISKKNERGFRLELGAGKSQNIKLFFRRIMKSKLAVAGMYLLVFFCLVGIIFTSQNSQKTNTSNVSLAVSNSQNDIIGTSVDDVIATNVAAVVAETSNLPIATSVSNLAISTQAQSEYMQSDGSTAIKPQIIGSSYENKSVISHTVAEGENVNTLAGKYGISAQTIKWANNLTTDSLSAGSVIRILPINGVLYNVKESDTIDTITKKYQVDATRLIAYNDLEVSGLAASTSIILPDGVLPVEERPGYVAPVVVYYYAGVASGFGGGQTWYISTGTGSGPYAYGNCTLYAYNRRIQLGLPVGGNWGNASSWAYNARLAGYQVDSNPSIGAIVQNGGGFGHVAIVEDILANGDISISEMNAYVSGGGWNIVSGRIVPASNIGQYLYIH